MKKSNILLVFGVFIVGVVIGILGTISFMDGEPKKATIPHSIEEKEQVPPVDEVAVPSVVEDTEENTDPDQNENVTPPPSQPIGVNIGHSKSPFGVVTKINLEKNNDGTWYVEKCELSNLGKFLAFESPYPQQNDLKEGDVIRFSGKIIGGLWYYSGQIIENLSSQSVKYKIDDIRELSTPSRTMQSFTISRGQDFVNVTGLIMAVRIKENFDPEPDNPSDYLIYEAVMKCADEKLYIADFYDYKSLLKLIVWSDYPNANLLTFLGTVNLPSHDAFGVGDIVSVVQIEEVSDKSFSCYYKGK